MNDQDICDSTASSQDYQPRTPAISLTKEETPTAPRHLATQSTQLLQGPISNFADHGPIATLSTPAGSLQIAGRHPLQQPPAVGLARDAGGEWVIGEKVRIEHSCDPPGTNPLEHHAKGSFRYTALTKDRAPTEKATVIKRGGKTEERWRCAKPYCVLCAATAPALTMAIDQESQALTAAQSTAAITPSPIMQHQGPAATLPDADQVLFFYIDLNTVAPENRIYAQNIYQQYTWLTEHGMLQTALTSHGNVPTSPNFDDGQGVHFGAGNGQGMAGADDGLFSFETLDGASEAEGRRPDLFNFESMDEAEGPESEGGHGFGAV